MCKLLSSCSTMSLAPMRRVMMMMMTVMMMTVMMMVVVCAHLSHSTATHFEHALFQLTPLYWEVTRTDWLSRLRRP